MTKATKPLPETIPVPQTHDECSNAIGLIGRAERALARIEADMSDAIEDIKTKAGEASKQHQEIIAMHSQGVEIFCAANRALLTNNGKIKHATFNTGVCRWRDQPAKVNVRGTDKILDRLKSLRSTEAKKAYRVKTEINKEFFLANPEAVKKFGLKGITIKAAGETFTIEPIAEEVSDQ